MHTLQPAYICVLIAVFLPYIWTTLAKVGGKHYDNADPRAWLERQDNARARRANAAHLNAFEALPGFIAAVVMAQLAQVPAHTINAMAMGFIAFRVLHGLFYVGNKPPLRSLVWFGGLACVVALMVSSILRVG